MGTSGVGPFIDDSNSRFCEFWRSATSRGTAISTYNDTRSSFLMDVQSSIETFQNKRENLTLKAARETVCPALSPTSQCRQSSKGVVAPCSPQVRSASHVLPH